jgi:hypothetical protein
MNRGFLKFAAVVLGTGLVVVPFLGLDGLPRDLRKQIAAERTAFPQTERQIKDAQNAVAHDLSAEPELFRGIPASQRWQNDLSTAASALQASGMDELTALDKQNHRKDRDRAATLLARERSIRTLASGQVAKIQKEADHWVELKKQLPETLTRMDRDYQMIRSFDAAPLTAELQKAQSDYPDKRADLQSRFDNEIRQRQAADEALWNDTAAARKQAASGNLAGLDTAALLTAAEKIHTDSALLPQKRTEIEGLVGQLNTSWDKVLVDMEKSGRTYKEQVRTVSTPKDGQTTSREDWVEVSEGKYDAQKNNLGMAIEHKPLGKYDIEADRVAQPAGFAYMAPPGQRNQYGYWDNRGGGQSFWVWYGQYALMRDLLFNHRYIPLPSYDYYEYRDYRTRGQTYYGRNETGSGYKYGTQGSSTAERYSGSRFGQSGGFKSSQYASKSGNYRDSQYATPGGNSAPKRFGSGSSSPPSGGFRPSNPRPSSPRPSFRPSPSTGRRFGRR